MLLIISLDMLPWGESTVPQLFSSFVAILEMLCLGLWPERCWLVGEQRLPSFSHFAPGWLRFFIVNMLTLSSTAIQNMEMTNMSSTQHTQWPLQRGEFLPGAFWALGWTLKLVWQVTCQLYSALRVLNAKKIRNEAEWSLTSLALNSPVPRLCLADAPNGCLRVRAWWMKVVAGGVAGLRKI